jgi:hypothetical protein
MDAIKKAVRDGYTVQIERVEFGIQIRLIKDKSFNQIVVMPELVFDTDYDVIQTSIEELQRTFRRSATYTGKVPDRLKPDLF